MHLVSHTIAPEWTDYNQHFNDGFYAVVFSSASEVFLEHMGLYRAYREATGNTVFTLETHISYLKELRQDDRVAIHCQLLGFDQKRIHIFLSMHHDEQLCATCEMMFLHVRQTEKRPANLPENIVAKLAHLLDSHKALPLPRQAGKAIKALRQRASGH